MAFNSISFAIFFFVVGISYFSVRSTPTLRVGLLLIASMVFYASWNLAYLPLLLGLATLNHFLGRFLAEQEKPRRIWLAGGILVNLVPLLFFKYTNQFFDAGATLLGFISESETPAHLTFVLPIGISFYTFQNLSYLTDCYRGTYQPRNTLLEYVSAVTFFPHVLAGPIVRLAELLPQFKNPSTPDSSQMRRGALLLSVGLLKKTAADFVGRGADQLYNAGDLPGFIESWTGVLAFAAQIYGDFSGYSDMAIGMAFILGFQFPENFHLPYLSRSPMDFWRRWHISLSSWFRDYLYLPLALGPLRKFPYLCLFLVLLFAGMWHGSGQKFLLFGVYHGVLLVFAQWLSHNRPGGSSLPRPLSILITFYFILLGQVIFRADSFASLVGVLRGMHFLGPDSPVSYENQMQALVVAIILIGTHLLDALLLQFPKLAENRKLFWIITTAAFATALVLPSARPFVYLIF